MTALGKRTRRFGRTGVDIRALMAACVAACLLPAASACSPEGGVELGQATSADRRDPCDLLTTEEMDSVLGWALPPGERPREHEAVGQAVCSWEDQRVGMVHLQLYEGDGTERFEQLREELEAIGEATDVDVAGAEAAWEDPAQGIVGILVGEHLAQVGVWDAGSPDSGSGAAPPVDAGGVVAGPEDPGVPDTARTAAHLRLAEIVAARL